MKIEENELIDIGQDIFEDKLSVITQTEKRLKRNAEIATLLNPVEPAEKSTVVNMNLYEEFTSHEIVQHKDSITLPMIQWSTSV